MWDERWHGLVQTSVVMPARIIRLLFRAVTAALKSGLSHVSTSLLRLISGEFGYRAVMSLGRAPWGLVSALVVRTTGKPTSFANDACAMMSLRDTVGS